MVEQGEPTSFVVFTILKLVHGFTYIILVLFLLKTHAQSIRDSFSNIDRINLNWLRVLTGFQIAIWGTVLGPDDLIPKRPGSGIPANQLDEVIGCTLARAVAADTLLQMDDLA